MPYNPGTGVYSLPAVYLAVPGTTILATQHNTPLEDLETANNYARPIIAGGTGQATAPLAVVALGAASLTTTNAFTKSQYWAKGANVASAAALPIGTDGNYFNVTGTSTITSIPTLQAGTRILLEFTAALILTHNATNLILLGAVNYITAAGDIAEFVSEGAGNWRMVQYQYAGARVRAGPGSSVLPSIGFIQDPTSGFYRSAGNEIAVTLSAGIVGGWSANGFNTGLGTALINPNGATVGTSLSNVGNIVSYATSGINVQLGYNGNFTSINFVRAAASVGTISHTPGATAYNTSSDYRIKEMVVTFDIGTAGDVIDRIRPVTYLLRKEFGGDGHTVSTGFIAHELQEVYPAAVTGEKDAVDDKGNAIIQGVDPSKLVVLLVAEIQSLRTRVLALENQLA